MSENANSSFLRPYFLVLVVLVAIVFGVMFFTGAKPKPAAMPGEQGLQAQVAQRIAPIGSVEVASPAVAPVAIKSGEEIVKTVCSACHANGVLGAPKIGNAADWGARLKQAGSLDGLLAVAIKGKGKMPPRGGSSGLSDAELKGAIAYMLKQSGVDASGGAAAPAPAMVTKPVPAPTTASAPSAADLAKGKRIYGSVCFACHATGAAGSPKFGDKAAWAPRIATGMQTLYHVALTGKGAMPPKGGRPDLPDADIKAAVDYMVTNSR